MNAQEAARIRMVTPVDRKLLRRKVSSDLLLLAREILGIAGKSSWEAPKGERKEWRRKKPDGSYEYSYEKPVDGQPAKEDKPEDKKRPSNEPSEAGTPPLKQDGTSKEQKPSSVTGPHNEVKEKKEEDKKPAAYKKHLQLDKPELEKVLSKGHFSIISAGRNPKDEKEAEMKPDDEFFHKRHEELRGELEKAGLSYTEVVGHYEGRESSFLVFHDGTEVTPKTSKSVIVHHKDAAEAKEHRKILEELGSKYNQNSVLHGSAGRNDIIFTSGEKKGKKCGGNGWKEVPSAKDYYTDIKLADKKHTKFALDINECFKPGGLMAD